MAVESAGPDASLHLALDRQPHQHPTALFFTGWMPFLPPNQQRQRTKGKGNRNTKNIKITTQKPIYAEKVCDMCTLLKYVKMQQYAKYAAIVYLHKTDMPNSYTAHVHEMCQCVEIYVHANSSSVYYVETFV